MRPSSQEAHESLGARQGTTGEAARGWRDTIRRREPNGGCGCDVESVVLEAFLRAVVGPAHRCEEPRVEGDRSDKGCHQDAGGVRVVLVRFRRDGQAQAPAGEHTRLGGLQGRGEGSFDSVDGALDQSFQRDLTRGSGRAGDMQVPPSAEYLFDTLRRVTDRLRLCKPDSTSGSGASGYRRQSNTCARSRSWACRSPTAELPVEARLIPWN